MSAATAPCPACGRSTARSEGWSTGLCDDCQGDSMSTNDCKPRIAGSKAKGFRLTCPCGWSPLTMFMLGRDRLQRECDEHLLNSERRHLERLFEADAIPFEEWRERMATNAAAVDALYAKVSA